MKHRRVPGTYGAWAVTKSRKKAAPAAVGLIVGLLVAVAILGVLIWLGKGRP